MPKAAKKTEAKHLYIAVLPARGKRAPHVLKASITKETDLYYWLGGTTDADRQVRFRLNARRGRGAERALRVRKGSRRIHLSVTSALNEYIREQKADVKYYTDVAKRAASRLAAAIPSLARAKKRKA